MQTSATNLCVVEIVLLLTRLEIKGKVLHTATNEYLIDESLSQSTAGKHQVWLIRTRKLPRSADKSQSMDINSGIKKRLDCSIVNIHAALTIERIILGMIAGSG